MSKVPLPPSLPGQFFLLEWRKDFERFVLHVDDGKGSNYNLGSDIQKVMMQFRIWGLKDLGDRVIDLAKEFGAAQGIPETDRAVPIFQRPSSLKRTLDWSREERTYAGHLPILGE